VLARGTEAFVGACRLVEFTRTVEGHDDQIRIRLPGRLTAQTPVQLHTRIIENGPGFPLHLPDRRIRASPPRKSMMTVSPEGTRWVEVADIANTKPTVNATQIRTERTFLNLEKEATELPPT